MENTLKANPQDVRDQYERQLKELQETYGEAMPGSYAPESKRKRGLAKNVALPPCWCWADDEDEDERCSSLFKGD